MGCLRTDLGVDELGQGADELRRRVEVLHHAFIVDEFADCEPQGGFEALGCRLVSVWA